MALLGITIFDNNKTPTFRFLHQQTFSCHIICRIARERRLCLAERNLFPTLFIICVYMKIHNLLTIITKSKEVKEGIRSRLYTVSC